MPITSDGRTKSRKLSYSCAWNEIRRSRWLDAFDMMPQFVQKPRNRGTCERDGILESKRIQCCGQSDSTTNIHRNKNNWWCLQDWIRYQQYITIPIVQNLLENREFVTMDILDIFVNACPYTMHTWIARTTNLRNSREKQFACILLLNSIQPYRRQLIADVFINSLERDSGGMRKTVWTWARVHQKMSSDTRGTFRRNPGQRS